MKKKVPHAERIYLPVTSTNQQIQRNQPGCHIFKEPLMFKENSTVHINSQNYSVTP